MQRLTGLLQPMDTALHHELKRDATADSRAGHGLRVRVNKLQMGTDVFFDLADIMSISQCGTSSWKAVGGLVAAISRRKGSLAIGFGDEGVYLLQEWDDRSFANNKEVNRTNGNF